MVKKRSPYDDSISESGSYPILIPMLILILIFLFFYRQDLLPHAIISGDLGVPYPYPPLTELSSSAPWYNLFSSFLYTNFYGLYGYVINYLQVFLYIPAYATMYILLREMNTRKAPAIALSMFYVLNPIVLPSVFSYTNLMWSEFYLFAPLFLFLIVRYYRSGTFQYLLLFSVLISFYLEIQTAPLFYNVRLLLPVLGIPLLYVMVKRTLLEKMGKRTAVHYALSFILFVILNFEPLLAAAGIASTTSSLAATSGSAFQSLHYENVVYTYQSQNLFFAISGLVVYPFYQNSFLMGMGQTYLPITAIFVTIVLIAVVISFLRRGQSSGLRITLSLSAIGIWAFISLTQAGLILPLFIRFPLLYLWEYPDYLESALVVLYMPILAGLFLNTNEEETWISSFNHFSFKLNLSGRIKGIRKKIQFLAPLIVAVLLLSYIVPMTATNTSGFTPIPGYETQNPLYHNLYSFFDNKSGNYKVLIVPFNQTTYKELGAAVPDSNILSLPYAYQNNPSSFANVTDFKTIYSDISTSQFQGFRLLLNNTGVEYVIALKTGNDANVAPKLSNLSYLIPVSNTNMYVILMYTGFSPVEVESDPYVLNTQTSNVNLTIDSEVSRNSNFTDLTGYSQSNPYIPNWGEYSSNLPYYQDFNFTHGIASVRVYGNVSNNTRQLSELTQRVNVPAGTNLNLTIKVLSQSNSYAYLYIIAHSNSSTKDYFSASQYFKRLPSNVDGYFSMTTTVPDNTQFVYFGVMVYNLTSGNGSLNLSSLRLQNVNNFSSFAYENTLRGELPFNSIEQSASNLSGYAYRSVLPLYPADGILNLSSGVWSSSAGTGFEVTKGNLSVNVHGNSLVSLSVEALAGTRVDINGVGVNSSFQGTVTGDGTSGTINISTSGNAVIKYIVLVSDVNAQFERNINTVSHGGKFVISNPSNTAVIVLTGSPFSPSPQNSDNVSLLLVQKINGVSEYLYVLMPGGTITYELQKSLINMPMVIFNITTFPVIVGVSVYGYVWFRKQRKQ